MTHGDMLSREERAQVRVFLGELLGIPPHKQIFDIPGHKSISRTSGFFQTIIMVMEMNCICVCFTESRDTATAITICNLLCYSLQHADKNFVFLPKKNFTISKVSA